MFSAHIDLNKIKSNINFQTLININNTKHVELELNIIPKIKIHNDKLYVEFHIIKINHMNCYEKTSDIINNIQLKNTEKSSTIIKNAFNIIKNS